MKKSQVGNLVERRIDGFKGRVIGTLIELENRDSVYVRRLRLLYDRGLFFLTVDKLKNRWADDSVSKYQEKKALERVKRWIEQAFVSLFMYARIDKFYFELDIRHGAAKLTVHDYGIWNLPDREIFKTEAKRLNRQGLVIQQVGNLYENPETWSDSEVDEPGYKTLSQIYEEAYKAGTPMLSECGPRMGPEGPSEVPAQ